MGIFDSLTKAANTFIEDINTPESFNKNQISNKKIQPTVLDVMIAYHLILSAHYVGSVILNGLATSNCTNNRISLNSIATSCPFL